MVPVPAARIFISHANHLMASHTMLDPENCSEDEINAIREEFTKIREKPPPGRRKKDNSDFVSWGDESGPALRSNG